MQDAYGYDQPPPALGLRVRELISQLQALDDETLVVLEAHNGGFVGVTAVEMLGLKLFYNTHPDFGPHEAPSDDEAADRVALVLRRG